MLKRGHLVASGAAAGAPLEAPARDVVEHRGPLGEADGMLLAGRQAVDAGRQVDVVGLAGDQAHHDLGRRHVAVLGQAVVLAEPGVLPVVLVGEDRVLRLPHQLPVFPVAVVRSGPWHVAVQEDAELHCVPPRSRASWYNVVLANARGITDVAAHV